MKNKKILKIIILVLFVVLLSMFFVRRNAINSQEDIQDLAKTVYEKQDKKSMTDDSKDYSRNIMAIFNTSEEREEFTLLKETFNNDDIVGYLTIEDTSIDYPVLQSVDNFFYLNNDIYKNSSIAGSIYLDYENDIETLDYNTIIYGHNMRDDIMFHSLRNYKNEEFYNEHKYIEFSTLYNDFVYEVFSVYETSIDFPYITVIFQNEDEFFELSKQFQEKSMYETEIELNKFDKVLTLSTCTSSNNDPNSRFVVQGRLISVNGYPYDSTKLLD